MTCTEIQDRLDDYVDGALSEAQFQEVELHLGGCAACRTEERLLRALLAEAAALPEERLPRRDLWADIAVRLDGTAGARPFWSHLSVWTGLAAAAAVVVAVSTLRGPGVDPPPPAGGSARLQTVATSPVPGLADAERDYARATAELMAVIAARRTSLPAETQEALDRNLQAIDEALHQIRQALAKEPSSTQLNHLLASTHRRKVEVLRRVVKLTRA
jgi:hypothetical protein